MVLNLMNVNYLVNNTEIEVTKSNQIRVIFQKYLQGPVHPLSKQGDRTPSKVNETETIDKTSLKIPLVYSTLCWGV